MNKIKKNQYAPIFERIFFSHYKEGEQKILFKREDIERVAKELNIELPKNFGDVIYSFRYRAMWPESIRAKAPEGEMWVIRPAGRARYSFELVINQPIAQNKLLSETKIPDATPGLVSKYLLKDEQALLAKVRYNRLIDVFTSVICYSIQNHLRTTVKGMGQVETDEIYVGVDNRGVHYIFPVQAKGRTDKLNIVQIEQDIALCKEKFSVLICRAIGAQFIEDNLIALFLFEEGEKGVSLSVEKHYRLVPPDEVTNEDLNVYLTRPF